MCRRSSGVLPGDFEGAAGDLQAAVEDGVMDQATGISLISLMDSLAGISNQIAGDAIANAQGGDPDKIATAIAYLAEGDALWASGKSGNLGDFKDAISKFKSAVAEGEGA